MTPPAWAEALLSSALRIHGKDVRKIRRAIAALEEKRALYDPPETRAAYQHVIDGLREHLVTLEQPKEAEKGP